MKKIRQYFLAAYSGSSSFEQRKALFLFYFILSALTVTCFVLVSQILFAYKPLYIFSGFIAFAGVTVSLFFFRAGRQEVAGHLMVLSVISMIVIQNVIQDIGNYDTAIRYRIYMNGASLIGTYLLILSFFRSSRVIIVYGILFEAILLAHTLVIYNNLQHLPRMASWVWQHYSLMAFGIVVVALVSISMLEYMNTIIQQNADYSRRIELQNSELELMVEERTRDLQNSNQSLREFAHIVSHDLKEPLRTISGFVTLIKRELGKLGVDDEDIDDYMRHVNRGTRQMENLISDILDYSKLNIEKSPKEPVAMEDVMAEVKSLLGKLIYESEASIHVINMESVIGDKRLLIQLFQNLVSNAIKYAHEERTPVITIGCSVQDGRVCYYVRDNGMGINEKYFDTIFHAFKRLHSRAHYEGTGIGLAICKKIVDVHRGRIWVDSTEGEGTTFFFTLPLVQTEVPATNPVVHAA
jgi:signal transduction histidine kinase